MDATIRFALLAATLAALGTGCAGTLDDEVLDDEDDETSAAALAEPRLVYGQDLTAFLKDAQNRPLQGPNVRIHFRSPNGKVRCAFVHVEPHEVHCKGAGWREANASKIASLDEFTKAKRIESRERLQSDKVIRADGSELWFGELRCSYRTTEGMTCYSKHARNTAAGRHNGFVVWGGGFSPKTVASEE